MLNETGAKQTEIQIPAAEERHKKRRNWTRILLTILACLPLVGFLVCVYYFFRDILILAIIHSVIYLVILSIVVYKVVKVKAYNVLVVKPDRERVELYTIPQTSRWSWSRFKVVGGIDKIYADQFGTPVICVRDLDLEAKVARGVCHSHDRVKFLATAQTFCRLEEEHIQLTEDYTKLVAAFWTLLRHLRKEDIEMLAKLSGMSLKELVELVERIRRRELGLGDEHESNAT